MDWEHDESPSRVVVSSAPIRVCDNGGWTDTWFAGHGAVCNVAVTPRVEVTLRLFRGGGRVLVDARSLGDRYVVSPDISWPGRQPLIEATVQEAGLPEGHDVEIVIRSAVPPGASTGTSAAVAVALIAGLDHVLGTDRSVAELATAAHRVEVERLGLQSGIQDQQAAAFGGINYLEMPRYPTAIVTPVDVADDVWDELDQGLALVLFARQHVSSEIHETVIAVLEGGGSSAVFDDLRAAALSARDALEASDLARYGLALQANTASQAALHHGLVNEDARAVIELARTHGALGWKVNGAGGDGGSLAVLCAPGARGEFVTALAALGRGYRWMPTSLSRDGALAADA